MELVLIVSGEIIASVYGQSHDIFKKRLDQVSPVEFGDLPSS
jgi:hypothetical protein